LNKLLAYPIDNFNTLLSSKLKWYNCKTPFVPTTISKVIDKKLYFLQTFGYYFKSNRQKLYFQQIIGYYFKSDRSDFIFCKSSVTISKVTDNNFIFCNASVTISKVSSRFMRL